MTFTEAAIEVLRQAGKPLHFQKISEMAVEQKLLSHVGKTPEVTMSQRLAAAVEIPRSDLVRVKPGIYGLREWDEGVPVPPRFPPAAHPPKKARPSVAVAVAAPESVSAEPGLAPPVVEAPLDADADLVREDDGSAESPGEPERDTTPAPGDDRLVRTESPRSSEREPRATPSRPPDTSDIDAGFFDEMAAVTGGGDEEEEQPLAAGRQEPAEGASEGGRRKGRRRGGRGRRRRGKRGSEEAAPTVPTTPQAAAPAPVPLPREAIAPSGAARSAIREERRPHGVLVEALIQSLKGHPQTGGLTIRQIVDVAQKRKLVPKDLAEPVATLLSAAVRENAERMRTGRRPRFRVSGDRIALYDWGLGAEPLRYEDQVEGTARRQRDSTRHALLERLRAAPMGVLGEIVTMWLVRTGRTPFRAPAGGRSELRLFATEVRGASTIRLAIDVVKGAIDADQVADLGAALAEQGASGGIFIATGELDPDVQRRLADSAALRYVHVYDGPAFVRALEEAAVGVQRYAVPLLYLDVELLDALG